MKRAPRKKIFLTGTTGNWGQYILREFARRADRFDVLALVPTAKDTRIIRQFEGMDNLAVAYGTSPTTTPSLHPSPAQTTSSTPVALVSPFADDHAELTHKVNVGGARNIIQAVKSHPDPDAVRVVTIGTVAQSGDRSPPHHWGLVGYPLRVSHYDEYSQSKVIAERELIDYGLKNFVSLHQTGIFHPGILEIRGASMTHTPLAGVLEWVSVEDASRLLADICEEGVPEEFWGGTYNISGGDGWRLTNWALEVQMTQAMGVKDPRKMVRPELVRRPELPRTLVHRLGPAPRTRADPPRHHADALARAVAAAPASVRMAGKIPAPLTMSWIDSNDVTKINAYFGSRHEWENIGTGPRSGHPGQAPKEQFLDHSYHEAKSPGAWTVKDMATDDCVTPLDWACAEGHTFAGSPRLILTAGHWCPECIKTPANYARQTAANSFLAQPETPTSVTA